MNMKPMTALCGMVVAAVVSLAGCGGDAAGDSVADDRDDAATSDENPAPAEKTTTEVGAEVTEAEVETWAVEVVAVYGELLANQVDNAVEFSDIFFVSGDAAELVPEAEVDAYAFLTTADAQDVAAAVERMPSSPTDPAVAGLYEAMIDALRAEANGADELAAELETDLDVLKQEVADAADEPEGPGGRLDEIRRAFSDLQDDSTSACFGLQAVMTERGLTLIDCTGE